MIKSTVDSDIPESALKDVGLHEQITAIDASQNDKLIPVGKLLAHLHNIRHVAISIFIFDQNRLLLQQRAATKYHSAGLWANTVCSHPRWQETAENCAQRRLQEELGWQVPLTQVDTIDYQAQVGELFENEHVHCFYGTHNQANDITRYNRIEVAETQWLTIPEIHQQLGSHPNRFTEWFKIYMHNHSDMIENMLSRPAS